jgi:peptide/nickel transport system substrate-binding protein
MPSHISPANTTKRRQADGTPDGHPRPGGILRLAGPGGADHLDTASAYYATSGQILRALTRQLFAYAASADLSDPKQTFAPVPDVALETPTLTNGGLSADRRIYTIRLRPDVMWDTVPPREVTAQDFVRGIKRIGNPVSGAGARSFFTSTIEGMQEYCAAYERAFHNNKRPTAAELAAFQNSHDIAGLRAPDERTLVIRLKQPAGDFLNILAMGFASAAPVEYDDYLPDSLEFRLNFISNGPYRIARYAPEAQEILLERNPAWRQDSDPIRHQYVDGIDIRVAKETREVMLSKIDAGEIDLAWSYTTVSWAKPRPDDKDAPRSYSGFALNPYLVFNLQSPNARAATRDPRVRQAIAYAIDRVEISQILEVMEGVPNGPLHSAIPPGSVGHRAFNLYPTPGDRGDPDKARRLIVDAGYGDGLTLIAAVRDVGLHRDIMAAVARSLAKCGITLTFRYFTQGEYYGSLLTDPAKARAGLWDIAEPGWTPDWFGNNGRAIVQPLFQTNFLPGTTNYGGYSNPIVDALIDNALQETDPAKADALWHEIDRTVMQDLPIVPILAFAAMTARYHSPRVKNAIHVPQIQFFDLTQLWLDPPDEIVPAQAAE